jgi:hypothetical protein
LQAVTNTYIELAFAGTRVDADKLKLLQQRVRKFRMLN